MADFWEKFEEFREKHSFVTTVVLLDAELPDDFFAEYFKKGFRGDFSDFVDLAKVYIERGRDLSIDVQKRLRQIYEVLCPYAVKLMIEDKEERYLLNLCEVDWSHAFGDINWLNDIYNFFDDSQDVSLNDWLRFYNSIKHCFVDGVEEFVQKVKVKVEEIATENCFTYKSWDSAFRTLSNDEMQAKLFVLEKMFETYENKHQLCMLVAILFRYDDREEFNCLLRTVLERFVNWDFDDLMDKYNGLKVEANLKRENVGKWKKVVYDYLYQSVKTKKQALSFYELVETLQQKNDAIGKLKDVFNFNKLTDLLALVKFANNLGDMQLVTVVCEALMPLIESFGVLELLTQTYQHIIEVLAVLMRLKELYDKEREDAHKGKVHRIKFEDGV